MRIKSAKQALELNFSGLLPSGGYEPKTQASGKKNSNDEILIELGIVMSPFNKLSDFHKKWAEYIYGSDDHLYKKGYLRPYFGMIVDDYALSLVEKTNKDTEWKISRLVEMIIDDFRATERNGKRIYCDADYCRRTGIDTGNYSKSWKWLENDIVVYLHQLSKIVLSPIAEKIEELRNREIAEAS